MPEEIIKKIINKNKIKVLLPEIFKNYGYGNDGFDLIKNICNIADNHKYKAFIVGGFTRDIIIYCLLKNKKTRNKFKKAKIFERLDLDVDISVEGNALEFVSLLKNDTHLFNILNIKKYKDFGTASVIFSVNDKPLKIDFASARTEIYENHGALPLVDTKYASIENDMLRRDFTINTLALSLNSDEFLAVKDFTGGLRDILGKKIKALHVLSFKEDPTRIFRAVRFEKRLGFKIDGKTKILILKALEDNVLNNVSGKRIMAELNLCAKEYSPWIYFERLEKLGALKAIHQALYFNKENLHTYKNIFRNTNLLCNSIKELKDNFIFYIAELLSNFNESDFESVALRLGLNERIINKIKLIYKEFAELKILFQNIIKENAFYKEKRLRNSEIYNLFKKFGIEGLFFYISKKNSGIINNKDRKTYLIFRNYLLNYIKKIRFVKPLLSGDDLKNAGICEGRLCGVILHELKLLKIDERLKTKEDEFLFVANKYLN